MRGRYSCGSASCACTQSGLSRNGDRAQPAQPRATGEPLIPRSETGGRNGCWCTCWSDAHLEHGRQRPPCNSRASCFVAPRRPLVAQPGEASRAEGRGAEPTSTPELRGRHGGRQRERVGAVPPTHAAILYSPDCGFSPPGACLRSGALPLTEYCLELRCCYDGAVCTSHGRGRRRANAEPKYRYYHSHVVVCCRSARRGTRALTLGGDTNDK